MKRKYLKIKLFNDDEVEILLRAANKRLTAEEATLFINWATMTRFRNDLLELILNGEITEFDIDETGFPVSPPTSTG